MGSRGTSNFSDYSGTPSSGTGGNGGSSGSDRCTVEVNAVLEDVARCALYKRSQTVPPIGSRVDLSFNGSRLEVSDLSGTVIGYLPTNFNYLQSCMEKGYSYSGGVADSRLLPMPYVKVSLRPV